MLRGRKFSIIRPSSARASDLMLLAPRRQARLWGFGAVDTAKGHRLSHTATHNISCATIMDLPILTGVAISHMYAHMAAAVAAVVEVLVALDMRTRALCMAASMSIPLESTKTKSHFTLAHDVRHATYAIAKVGASLKWRHGNWCGSI